MKKDAYYFSHDANAQDDPKCMSLIDQLGMEGYGVFWALIEKLRSESEHKLPLNILPALAKRWSTKKETIENVIKNFKLFSIENEIFWSERLTYSMNLKSEKARQSANYRWNNATAMQTHTDRNANGMRNDAIKVKESKEKEIMIDTMEDVFLFLKEERSDLSERTLRIEAGRLFSNGLKQVKNKVAYLTACAKNMSEEERPNLNAII